MRRRVRKRAGMEMGKRREEESERKRWRVEGRRFMLREFFVLFSLVLFILPSLLSFFLSVLDFEFFNPLWWGFGCFLGFWIRVTFPVTFYDRRCGCAPLVPFVVCFHRFLSFCFVHPCSFSSDEHRTRS